MKTPAYNVIANELARHAASHPADSHVHATLKVMSGLFAREAGIEAEPAIHIPKHFPSYHAQRDWFRLQELRAESVAFKKDINAHLDDIVNDVERVRRAFNAGDDGEGPEPKIAGDAIKSSLSEVSNALDGLYNDISGI